MIDRVRGKPHADGDPLFIGLTCSEACLVVCEECAPQLACSLARDLYADGDTCA